MSNWREHAGFTMGEVRARHLTRPTGDGHLTVFVAEEPAGWHLSIGHRTRYPTWDEIRDARYALLPQELDFVMHLPPPEHYVNLHTNTFHLHQHPER